MIDKNYSEKLAKIETQMNIWSARTLTPLGRNTVLKSLLLPKLNHLFAALPNPPDATIDKLQKLCYKFVWKGKPDKIKRKVVILNPKHGGFKVPKISEIITAQKLGWIRRLITTDNKWQYLFYKHLTSQDFLWMADSNYINMITPQTFTNAFWRDTLYSWSKYIVKRKNIILKESDLQSQPLWQNNNITIGNKSFYYKQWHQKGIVFINDLLNINGNLLTYDEFSNVYLIKTNFLIYESVKQAVCSYIKKSKMWPLKGRLQNPILPFNFTELTNEKGTRHFYEVLLNSTFVKLPCNLKWEERLDKCFTDKEWETYNIIANKCTQSTELKWLHYKIVHHILPTKTLLFKMKLVDSPLCAFCNIHLETIDHLFWECDCIQQIWKDLNSWISNELQITLKFNIQNIILGMKGVNNNPVNAILLVVKQIIYRHSINKTIPNIDHIKKQLAHYYNITKYIYIFHSVNMISFSPFGPPFI